MLDMNEIRKDPDRITQALLKRMDEVDLQPLLQNDERYREVLTRVERLKAQRNAVSAMIPQLKKRGEDVKATIAEMKEIGETIRKLDEQATSLRHDIQSFLERLPNLPADDVVAGDASNNTVMRQYKERPEFSYDIKDHVELAESLGLIDYERGAKIAGSGFWIYTGKGAMLEWALLNFFIREHNKDGYTFMLPPHILNRECGYSAGQFPKFQQDVFAIEKHDETSMQFLLPTAETALAGVHAGEIFKQDQLPMKYFAYTPCYRKEAGSYRTDERGMIRGHQFNKVELFQYTMPEDSEDALEELIDKAESLVKKLDLHYRVSKLAAKDCSDSMGKTYDIEIWLPSMNQYKEISSASNAYAYQARRGNIRFRRADAKKNEFVHTLNASGLATSRLVPAILEQNQQANGSVKVPDVLQEALGMDVFEP